MPDRRARRITWASLAATGALVAAGCGTRLPDSAFATSSVPATAAPGGGATTTTAGTNTASDVGVTADTIKVGVVASETSPFGGDAFGAGSYGVRAFFEGINRTGGISGRQVEVVTCDDGGNGAGNQDCVRRLIEQDQVFALVGTAAFDYAGAAYVNDAGVPDIGGQPIGNEYETYPHLFSIYGSSSPRTGTVGDDGTLYGGTEVYRYFKDEQQARRAAVVAYNQADSLRYARYTEDGLKAEGFEVTVEQVPLGVPNWDAVVLDMKDRKVQLVFDALESGGNVNLCRAIDRNDMDLVAKVVTVQGWTDEVRTTYGDAPRCRNALWATSGTRNYEDVRIDPVKRFRADMEAAFPDRSEKLSMWTLEGWGAGLWFAHVAEACGAALTRACVEEQLNTETGWDGDGLFTARDFRVKATSERDGTTNNCLNVARWSDDGAGGTGAWVTQTKEFACLDAHEIAYQP